MQWIYERPKFARIIGRTLFSGGGFIIICGLIARAGMAALNQARSIGKMPPYTGISEAYPMYPLWWIPEHFLGYAVGVLIAGTCLYLALTAKSVLKVVRGEKGRYG